jgi:hypothetical protein
MVKEPRNQHSIGGAPLADVRLVTLSGVALVNAAPESALDVARSIGAEFPGGCPCLFVIDCGKMTDGQVAFAMGWYLAENSRGRVSGSLVLLRELQCLSRPNQQLLAQLIVGRRRGDDAVRVVASSSVDLYQQVCDDQFDASLYYLVNVVTLAPTVRRRATNRPPVTQPDSEGDSTGSHEL